MIVETEPRKTPAEVWVELRADDGDLGTHRGVVVYIGKMRRDLLDAWARIEHGECWFLLDQVCWYQANAEAPPARESWYSRLFSDPAEEQAQVKLQPLKRQSVSGRYWGYSDQVYLRLDRVFRITPLSERYVQEIVLPALSDADEAVEEEAAAIE